MIYYQQGYQDAKHIRAAVGGEWRAWRVGDRIDARPLALIGSIDWTYAALDAIGIARPQVISYETFPSMRRHFKRPTLQCSARHARELNFPLFVKPADNLKQFEARVYSLEEFRSMKLIYGNTCDVSEPVEFSDEFRTFWRRDDAGAWKLEGSADYPMIEEGAGPVEASRLEDIAPSDKITRDTLTIDIGTIDKGKPSQRQAIVEIGDMFAMGTYGADAAYFRCHVQWLKGLGEATN